MLKFNTIFDFIKNVPSGILYVKNPLKVFNVKLTWNQEDTNVNTIQDFIFKGISIIPHGIYFAQEV